MMLLFQFVATLVLSSSVVVQGFSPASNPPPQVHSPLLDKTEKPSVLSSPPLTSAILVDEFADPSFSYQGLSQRWNAFVPDLWESPRGIDVAVTWNAAGGDAKHTVERCEEAAHKWWKLAELQGRKVPEHGDAFVVQDLTHFMLTFVTFCETHLEKPPKSYKARIAATRGRLSTKCPQWHLDHVPVRWIQALVGRGVEWVDPEAVQWENMNALQESADELFGSAEKHNIMLVNEKAARLSRHQAPTGRAALLLGKTWSTVAKDGIITPCVHKSPGGFMPWEGRVVLIMDVDVGEGPEEGE